MATDCMEFWKIEGNILDRTHHESPTEKNNEKVDIGVMRRLSRKSSRIQDDLQNSLMQMQIDKAVKKIKKKRNSYVVPEKVIFEDNEESNSSSSSLKSKPPTSKTSSDEKSSYNIFGEEEKLEKAKNDRNRLNPNIEIIRLSSKNIQNDVLKNSKSQKVNQPNKPLNASSSSSSSESSESVSEASKRNSSKKPEIDPDIIAILDPRLVSPSYLSKKS